MASLFRDGTTLMVKYARYHRDRRNILSHFVGIPLIVFAVGVLLTRPVFEVASVYLTPALLVWALTSLWYLTRGLGLVGLSTVSVNAGLIWLAHLVPSHNLVVWLAWGVGAFVLGWFIQFVGHYWEGKKPAFVDDLIGLLVGPAFVVGEWLFAAGLCREMEQTIEREAGPVRTGPAQQLT